MASKQKNSGSLSAGVDAYQAAYWKGYISRGEVQTALEPMSEILKELVRSIHGDDGFDRDKDGNPTGPQQRQAFTGLMEIIARLDAGISFLMEKGGYQHAEVQAWHDEQVAKFTALVAAKKAEAEAKAKENESGRVTLE
jgi:hypothetical protein